MPWLTPAAVEATRQVWAIDLPSSPAWRRPVWGALLELTYAANWEEIGLSAEATADIMREVYGSIRRVHVLQPGDIIHSAAPPPQPDRLPCDGGMYNATEYPELFSAIGYTYGGSGASFAVPDITGRVIAGVGSGAGLTPRNLGTTGGAERVTILEAHLPPHQHTIHQHIPGIAQLGVGEPVSLPALGSDLTGSAGNGDDLETMPPFIALTVYIVAR